MTLSLHSTSSQVQATATTTSTVPLPTNSAGDFMIVFAGHADESATDMTASTGWARIGQLQSATGGGQFLSVWTKISNGAETNPTFTIVGGTPVNQFWASGAASYTDSSGNQPVLDQIFLAEDTVGPVLTTPSLSPSTNGCVIVSFDCCDQNTGVAPSIGSVTTTSSYTITKEKDVIGGGAHYGAMADEIQTVKRPVAHTYNYTGAGTAARGAAMAIVSIAPPIIVPPTSILMAPVSRP